MEEWEKELLIEEYPYSEDTIREGMSCLEEKYPGYRFRIDYRDDWVKKWLKYRKVSLEGMNPDNSLLLLEDIIYEIRKDAGQRKKSGKGGRLSIFINDVEKIIEKN